MTQKDMLQLSKDFKAGVIPEETIKEIEKINNRSIEEIVAYIDRIFLVKKHHLEVMTIPDIRKWLNKKKISEEEKKFYADVNNCTYEEAVRKAKERLEKFDIEQEFKQLDLMYGLTPETRESRRKSAQELVDNGYGEWSSEGNAVIMKDGNIMEYLKDKMMISDKKQAKK